MAYGNDTTVPRGETLDDTPSLILVLVVHDHDLEVTPGLIENALQRDRKGIGTIIGWHQDA